MKEKENEEEKVEEGGGREEEGEGVPSGGKITATKPNFLF